MRPIDADKFQDFIRENCADSLVDLWCELVRRQPTIEAVPVVHGNIVYRHDIPHCFICGKVIDANSKYCKWCGAKMKGGK